MTFLRPGLIEVEGAESRLDMAERNLAIGGREGAGIGARCVALDEKQAGIAAVEPLTQAVVDGLGDLAGTLFGRIDIEDRDGARRQEIERGGKAPMLPGEDDLLGTAARAQDVGEGA